MSSQELTTAEVAARLAAPERTVRLWCKQGLFPGARPMETPRGPYWLIPESAVRDFMRPQPGRPPKASASGQKHDTIASQTKITRKHNNAVKRTAEEQMGSKKKVSRKAIERWEGEGGAVLPKKGGKK